MPEPLLAVEDLWVAYDRIQAVQGVSFEVAAGEIVCLIGANGAGKSTILRAVSGLTPISRGTVRFDGAPLTGRPPHRIAQAGIVQVPEGRGIFGNLTVAENLRLATYGRSQARVDREIDRVLELFPRLAARRQQWGSTLSGGEQQMLAVGRALMRRARLLLLDEPSMGLAPLLVKEIFKIIRRVNEGGATVLLVEQNAHQALKIAHRGYVLETGRFTLSGPAAALAADPQVREAYLGR